MQSLARQVLDGGPVILAPILIPHVKIVPKESEKIPGQPSYGIRANNTVSSKEFYMCFADAAL